MTSTQGFRGLIEDPRLLAAIEQREWIEPTEVQREAIPVVRNGQDLIARAKTGSGKTAAFALPILEAFAREESTRPRITRALVLAPTRELAMQIGDVFVGLSRSMKQAPRVMVFFGGGSVSAQMQALRGGADIVVATPGRLLDLVDKNALSLRGVRVVVLDEADRLLDAGFGQELSQVFGRLPQQRQTLLFSATFPPALLTISEAVTKDAVRIDIVPEEATAADIIERAIEVDRPRRTQLVRRLLEELAPPRALVFVATTYSTEHVSEKLRGLGVSAAALHGKLSQGARIRTLEGFRQGQIAVLVATDVAARGLDITGLPLVINYDLPRSPDDYVHRIGRTGRRGNKGLAISLITAETHAHFRLIEKRVGRTVGREALPGFEPIEPPVQPPSNGGIKGKRKSKKDKLREAAARKANTAG